MLKVLRARPTNSWLLNVSRCLVITALVAKAEAGDEPPLGEKFDPAVAVAASVVSGIANPLNGITSLVSLKTVAADDAIQAAEGPRATVTKISIEPDQEFSDPPVSWSVGFSKTGHAYWAMYGEKEITLVMGTLAEPERQVKCRIPREHRYAGVEPIWSQDKTTVILPTLRDRELVILSINAADGTITDTPRPLPEKARTIYRVILSADDSTLFTLYQPDDLDGVSLGSFDLKTSNQDSFRIRDVNLSYADMFIPTSGENAVVLTDRCQVWNLGSKSRLTDFGIRYGSNARFAEFANGKSFALLNGEDELAIWDISEPKNPVKRSTRTLQPWMREVHKLTADTLGERISVAGKGHVAWSSANSELSGFLRIADHYPYAGTNICSCNRYAITGGQEIRLWNLAPFEIQRNATQIGEVDFEPYEFFTPQDEQMLVVKGENGANRVAAIDLRNNKMHPPQTISGPRYSGEGFDLHQGRYYSSRKAPIGHEVEAYDPATRRTETALAMSDYTRTFSSPDNQSDLTMITLPSGDFHLLAGARSNEVIILNRQLRKTGIIQSRETDLLVKENRVRNIVSNPAAKTFLQFDYDIDRIRTYDANTGRQIADFPMKMNISHKGDDMFSSVDGQHVFGILPRDHIWRLNTTTGNVDQPFVPCDSSSGVSLIAASRSAPLVAGAVGSLVHVWNTNTGELLHTFEIDSPPQGGLVNLSFALNGTALCAVWHVAEPGSRRCIVYRWNIPQ